MNQFPEECHVKGCPCHEFALKRPQEASSGEEMAQDSRNVKTPPTHPGASGIAIPNFEHDWNHAPRSRQLRTEQEDALFWYIAGGRAKEEELLKAFNEESQGNTANYTTTTPGNGRNK